MSKLNELIAQRESLEKAIEAARQEEIKHAVDTVRGLVQQFKLTPTDVFGGKFKSGGGKRMTVAPKYRNPATGATWSGRGKAPKWIAGQNFASFAI